MKNFFNHILVPINFNKNTSLVMEKAIQIANQFDSDLYLIHVQTPLLSLPYVYEGFYLPGMNISFTREAENKMNQLVKDFKPQIKEGLQIKGSVLFGNWYAMMKESIITNHIDLVLIPRSKKRFFGSLLHEINLNKLAQQSQCPILTVTPEFDINHLQHIVVPVDNFLPIRKLTMATFLGRKFNAMIHLTGSGSNHNGKDIRNSLCLAKSYQLLNKYTQVKVHYPSEQGRTIGEDSLDYAKTVRADLIVVNPGKESKLGKWFNALLGKYLYRESNIPVLTISPKQ